MDGAATVVRRQIAGEGWAIASPDGHHLAIDEWTPSGNLWMVER